MRDGLRALEPREEIAFFCECDRSDCYQVVWLSGADYDRLRAEDGWRALAAVHGVHSEPLQWPDRAAARRRSRTARVAIAR